MNLRPLDIYLGPGAARQIAEHGWRGADVGTLLGASGGPKWLILGHLDRVLFGQFLRSERATPLRAIGSSVGSWRHACLAQADPGLALQRFEDIYLNWEYSARPDVGEISRASATMLAHIFGDDGAHAVVSNPQVHSYIVTARGRGLNGAALAPALATGLGAAALANAVDRRLLATQFQRVLFTSAGAPPLPLADFDTTQVPLTEDTVALALHASGSIPFVLRGERDIPGAPPGHYWDGGIIDYHFSPSAFADDRLVLYPHFRADLTAGWFDKFLPWRRHRRPVLDKLVLLCPSRAFLASLPLGKIPDRSDFRRLSPAQRRDYWRICVERSRELADDFRRQLEAGDPLDGTLRLGEA